MKIKFRFSIVLAAIVAAGMVSCNVEEIPDQVGNDVTVENDETAGNDEVQTFTCVIADTPEGKVSISEQGKVRWEAGDQILIHGKSTGSGAYAIVTLKSSDISSDGKTATISFSGVTPYDRTDKGYTSSLYAGYPANAVATGETCYYYTNFKSTTTPLMAAYDDGKKFVFYNLCGVLSFRVSGDFDTVTLSGNAGETVGYEYLRTYLVQQSTGKPRLDFTYSNESDGGTSGPLAEVTGPVTADGTTVNNIGIPLGVDFTQGFTLRFKKNGAVVKVAKSVAPAKIDRSKLLALGDITSHLQAPSASESHESSIDISSATDLGASETANCYIVSAPGAYKFKAVKGNSGTSVGSIASVELLWETFCNSTAPEKNSIIEAVDYEGYWIAFRTPSSLKPGNALIAAKNESGNILWSWHIWIPETEIQSGSYDISSHLVMDRNLGALVVAGTGAVEANGLFYQWGRKDPFVGIGAHGSSSKASVAGTAMSVSGAAANSASEGIANPTKFYVGTGSVSNYDWLTTSDVSLWGTSKTIHDPCPPGWRVPDYKEGTIYTTQAHTLEGFSYNTGTYSMTVGSAVFPLTGYLHYSSGNVSEYDTAAKAWTTHSSSGEKAGLAVWMSVTGAEESNNWSERKARGCSVRCVSYDNAPFENEPGMPVQGGYTRVAFDSNIQELSGICFSKDKDFIWGVGDEGDIFKIYLDWTKSAITLKSISIYKSTGSDLEDVTLDPNTGDLYFAKEADRVDKMAAPNYSSKTTAFYVADAASFGNSGLEGIAWYKDNTLYVGAQTGATLWKYKPDGTMIWKKQLGSINPRITEVGGLCYDWKNDWLWVSDSEACKLFVFDGEVTKLLAIYDVSSVGNAESVLVDPEHNCVLVGDDGSSSKIYKYSFTGL